MPLLKGQSYMTSTSCHYGQLWAQCAKLWIFQKMPEKRIFMLTLLLCFKVTNYLKISFSIV